MRDNKRGEYEEELGRGGDVTDILLTHRLVFEIISPICQIVFIFQTYLLIHDTIFLDMNQ